MNTTSTPTWLTEALVGLATGDVDAWLDLFSDDAVHEFPFANAGEVRALRGRKEIAAFMRDLGGRIRFGAVDEVTVREAGEDLVIEALGHHLDVETGAPFTLRYVWVITRRDGRVTLLRDYMGARQYTAASV